MPCESRPAPTASRATAAAARRASVSRPRQANWCSSETPSVPMTPGFPVAAEISNASAKQCSGSIEPARLLFPRALVVERYQQRGQRPLVAGEPDPAAGQRVLGLFVPQLRCGNAAEPEPAQAIGRSEIVGARVSRWHGGTAARLPGNRRPPGRRSRPAAGRPLTPQIRLRPASRAPRALFPPAPPGWPTSQRTRPPRPPRAASRAHRAHRPARAPAPPPAGPVPPRPPGRGRTGSCRAAAWPARGPADPPVAVSPLPAERQARTGWPAISAASAAASSRPAP